MNDYMLIGTIANSKGLNGRLKIKNIPSYINNLEEGTKVKIGFSIQYSKQFIIKDWNQKKNESILTLLESISADQINTLNGSGIFIQKVEEESEQQSSFFIDDILHCQVIEKKTKQNLGIIIDVWVLPANDVWIVQSESKKIYLPVIDEVIKKIDIKNKTVYVELIDGLTGLENK